MGFVNRAFVAAGVGFVVSAIAGCGSSGGHWLSQTEASTLSGQLNQVQLALNDGECAVAQRYLSNFENSLSNDGDVNSTLIANLNQGASTIQSLTSTECATHTVTTPRTHTTRTRTTPSTTTTVTQTVPTFTQTTTTYPTQTSTYTEPTTSSTSTTGGVGPTGDTTTTTSTTSTTTTPGNGGSGLGGTDTLTTSTSSDTTTTSGGGF